jgi:hypothetical protein
MLLGADKKGWARDTTSLSNFGLARLEYDYPDYSWVTTASILFLRSQPTSVSQLLDRAFPGDIVAASVVWIVMKKGRVSREKQKGKDVDIRSLGIVDEQQLI